MPRAWMISDYTGYKGLELRKVPIEEPGPGEVRIRVEAFALNWGDMDLMCDRYSFSFPHFPARIGIEASGTIEKVGPGVSGCAPGDRVSTLPYFYYNRGASTESLVISADYVTPAPPNLSPVESASVWMQFLTAYFPLGEITPVGDNDHVLVTAGTSTAGSAALQIGRLFGASLTATTRYAYNHAYLEEQGADHVIVAEDGNALGRELAGLTDFPGFSVAFDPVGASMLPHYSKLMRPDARIFFYGTLDETFPALPLVDMLQRNTVFHPYSLFNYIENHAARDRGVAFVHDRLVSGELKPAIDRIFPMEQYREAFEYMSQPRTSHGKIVVETGLA